MNKSVVAFSNFRFLFAKCPITTILCRNFCNQVSNRDIAACYRILNLPLDSDQEEVREAFLSLAKKYHPDSGSPQASIDKFVSIENAFRTLTKHITGNSSKNDVEKIVFDIRHTAPQHRQYLSYEGVGSGTPFQRQKQWQAARAQRAAENVMDHRLAKSVASEGTLMQKDQGYPNKHDIKTKYGFDRVVEDLIQESMSKGEFENLSGTGKPLKDQNRNPYVDFTTHKLNEVLINNGFTPEWITMSREIDTDIESLKEEIKKDRSKIGPHPLTDEEKEKWERICQSNRELASSINMKINKFNLIVPLLTKQKFHVCIDEICEDILKTGPHAMKYNPQIKRSVEDTEKRVIQRVSVVDDLLSLIFKALSEIFSFGKKMKN